MRVYHPYDQMDKRYGCSRTARAGLCDIIYDIVYDIEDNSTDIVYNIDILYRIPINMEDYGLVVSYVYIVPLFYLNCLLKEYPR